VNPDPKTKENAQNTPAVLPGGGASPSSVGERGDFKRGRRRRRRSAKDRSLGALRLAKKAFSKIRLWL